MRGLSAFFLFIFVTTTAYTEVRKAPDAETLKAIAEHNLECSKKIQEGHRAGEKLPSLIRPYAEFERARYVIFSDLEHFDAKDVKDIIAKNLPMGTTLVVMVTRPDKVKEVEEYYLKLVKTKAQLKVVHVDTGLWVRDSLPVPTFRDFPNPFKLALTNAKYYHFIEPDAVTAKLFKSPLLSHEFFFEGGNFLADSKGTCFVVDNDRAKTISDTVFFTHYGCIRTVRFPYVGGVGHTDERIKILNDRDVLTDTESYVPILENAGYRVTLLPRGEKEFETYMNALLVNNTLFLPVFGIDNDKEVINTYRSFNLNVIPITVDKLPNNGNGSIHCITMTYPDVPFDIF